MTIEELYQKRIHGDEYCDIFEHLATLRRYASLCPVVVEFGTRTGNTTTAFLAGGSIVHSYDIRDHRFPCPEDAANRWVFHKEDTAKLESIPECDMLFIDSLHAENHVRAELRQHVHVKRFIGLHDTLEWGSGGDDGGHGINWALFPFLAEHNRTWRVAAHWNNCKGLTILERIGT